MLYRWPIIGHAKQLEALERDISQTSLASVYLFTGPSDIGKFTVARLFAQILQCPYNFCRECLTCKHIEKHCHFDTVELPDDGTSIKIEQIRDLITTLYLSAQSRYKIVLLQNTERLTREAANCLLKTLEEPNRSVVFILTSGNIKDVLPTIVSRARILSFRVMPESELIDCLRQFFPEKTPQQISKCVAYALGKSARAMTLLQDSDLLLAYEKMYEMVYHMLEQSSIVSRFALMENLSQEPAKINLWLQLLSYALRRLLLKTVGYSEDKEMLFENYSAWHLMMLLTAIEQTRLQLNHNVNPKLVLENLLLKL